MKCLHSSKFYNCNLLVGRIKVIRNREELFLDEAWTCEAEHRVGRSGLVVGATRSASSEALLANKSSSGLAV